MLVSPSAGHAAAAQSGVCCNRTWQLASRQLPDPQSPSKLTTSRTSVVAAMLLAVGCTGWRDHCVLAGWRFSSVSRVLPLVQANEDNRPAVGHSGRWQSTAAGLILEPFTGDHWHGAHGSAARWLRQQGGSRTLRHARQPAWKSQPVASSCKGVSAAACNESWTGWMRAVCCDASQSRRRAAAAAARERPGTGRRQQPSPLPALLLT